MPGGVEDKGLWTTAAGRDSNGHTKALTRFDAREGSPQEKQRLTACLQIAVSTAFTEEAERSLVELEDRVAEALGDRGRLKMVIDRLEAPTRREFVFYAEPGVDSATLRASLRQAFPALDVQVQASSDPEWTLHQENIDMANAGSVRKRSRSRVSLWLSRLRELLAPPPRHRPDAPVGVKANVETSAGGRWKLGVLTDKSESDGQTVVARLDVSLEPDKRDPRFDTRLGVAVPSKLRRKDLKRFEELENWLIAELAGRGVLALVMSGVDQMTFREFVCYVERGIDFPQLHDRLQAAFRSLDVQMYAETDPDWEVYEEMKAALNR